MEENREKKEKTGFMAQGRSVLIAIIAALSAIICVSILQADWWIIRRAAGEAESRQPVLPAVI